LCDDGVGPQAGFGGVAAAPTGGKPYTESMASAGGGAAAAAAGVCGGGIEGATADAGAAAAVVVAAAAAAAAAAAFSARARRRPTAGAGFGHAAQTRLDPQRERSGSTAAPCRDIAIQT